MLASGIVVVVIHFRTVVTTIAAVADAVLKSINYWKTVKEICKFSFLSFSVLKNSKTFFKFFFAGYFKSIIDKVVSTSAVSILPRNTEKVIILTKKKGCLYFDAAKWNGKWMEKKTGERIWMVIKTKI